jgi:hypothetical protein
VSVRFIDPETKLELRSTEFARSVLAAAAKNHRELQQNLFGAPDWRRWYIRLYAELATKEGLSKNQTIEMATLGLERFQSCLKTGDGESLLSATAKAFDEDLVETIQISGTSAPKAISIAGHSGALADTAKVWVEQGLAEPGLVESLRFIDDNPDLDLSQNVLFAVAGAAEFAPTEHWLSWGGTVAVVARPNQTSWQKLLEMARSSGGKMLIPVKKSLLTKPISDYSDQEISELAGLDLLEDFREISSWMKDVSSRSRKRFILGLYAYTPKIDHIRVQGVQDSLVDLAMKKFKPDELVLSWLATPTDSSPGPASIADYAVSKFSTRSPGRVLRDSFLGLFSAARPVRPRYFTDESGQKLALIDSSVQQQGPSYSFSKRTQRWRAYLAHYAGVRVSYAISPPARTNSVLRHKILRASYRGAPHFGIQPFNVDEAKSAVAAVLVRDVHDQVAYLDKESTTQLHTFSAIHGGLWRSIYKPSSIWIVATILGLPALLKKGY